LAIDIAERIGAEIISVDSMQVYRGMDVGTAKPTVIERRGIPHHMIDLVDPSVEFSVADFRRIGRETIAGIEGPAMIVGGSGLHFRALVDPMSFAPTDLHMRSELENADRDDLVAELIRADPAAGDRVDLANRRRVVRAVEVHRLTGETPSSRAQSAEAEELRRYQPEIEFTAIGMDPGEMLDSRIEHRLDEMREGGLVEEVAGLRGRLGRTAASAVGYREILAHFDGEMSQTEAFKTVMANTRRLARRQRTWFQRDPRIRWVPWLDDPVGRVDRALGALEA
jgi:tRNA dimethylallyltransferase